MMSSARYRICVTIGLLASALPFAARGQERPADRPAPATQAAPPMSAEDLIKLADDVQREVEEMRGWKFKQPVKKDVRSEDQLRKFIEKRVFEEELGQGRLEGKEAALRLVGLLPPDCDMRKVFMDVLLNQIGGFYDPQTKAFYMLVRSGVDYGPLVNRIMIAHELTHALDDQYVDLDKLMKSHELTEDWGYTVGGVVEGSATVLMSRYAMAAMLSGKYDIGELQRVMANEEDRSKAFLEAPPYFSTLLANYLCGMNFMIGGDMSSLADPKGERAIAEKMLKLAKRMPESSEQILHPEKYWDDSQRDAPVVVDDDSILALLGGDLGTPTHRDTFGELLCGLLTTEADRELDITLAVMPGYWTNNASEGWGGDRIFVMAGAAGNDAAKAAAAKRGVWVTAWDTARDRDEFVRTYATERQDAARSVALVGRRVAVFFYGFDDATRTAIETRLSATPPKFMREGKPWNPDAAE